jgi:thymidylate synthase (FAD)
MKHLPAVKLLYYMRDGERIVASSAKATLSPREFSDLFEGLNDEDVERWLRELIIRGHGSPLEHSVYIFEIVCSRVCSHQLVRHRHASYTQLSQRYSDKYLKGLVDLAAQKIGVPRPSSYIEIADLLERLARSDLPPGDLLEVVSEAFIVPPTVLEKEVSSYIRSLLNSTAMYYRALAAGVPYEDARYLLPQAVKTRVIVSMNARELVEVFLPLRMCSRAHWEIRLVAWQLWKSLVEVHPEIFKYAGPRCVLFENRCRVEPCTLLDFLERRCSFTIERCPEKIPRDKINECLKDAYFKVSTSAL